MGLTLSNYNTLIIDHESAVVETVADEARMFEMFAEEMWGGDFKEFHVHTRRTAALGNNQVGGRYRKAANQGAAKARVYRKVFDGTIQVSLAVDAASQNGGSATGRAVDWELQRITRDAAKYHNGFTYGDGTGIIAEVSSLSTNDLYLKINDRLLPGLLWDDAYIEIFANDETTDRGTAKISKVNKDLSSSLLHVTLTDNNLSGVTAGDYVYWVGSEAEAPATKGRAFSGLKKLVDDSTGTFQNISVTNNPRYASTVLDNSGTLRDVSAALFRQAGAAVATATNMAVSNGLALCNPYQKTQLDQIEQDKIRYQSTEARGSVVDMIQTSFGPLAFETDVDCPDTTIYIGDPSEVKRFTQHPLGFLRRGGDVLFPSTEAAVYVAHLYEIMDLGIYDRRKWARIGDLNSGRVTGFGQ